MHDTCKHTMMDIFSGSTAKAKRQESERKQQTVLHNVQIMVSFPDPSCWNQIVRAREGEGPTKNERVQGC